MRMPELVRSPLLEVGYRLGGWPRRIAALFCLVVAAATSWPSHRPAVGAPSPVVIAARNLAAGTVLRAADVRLAHWTPAQVPAQAVRSLGQAVGSAVGAGIDRGEPITTARLRGSGITVGLPANQVAETISISGPDTVALIKAGDTVDLLATSADVADSAPARVVASGVRVLAVLTSDPSASDGGTAGLVVAVTRATALALATVPGGSVTATLRMPP